MWCFVGIRLLAQNQTALCTTARENLAAFLGCHSLAETVDLGSMQLLGLISTLCHVEIHLLKFYPAAACAAPTRRRMKKIFLSPQLTVKNAIKTQIALYKNFVLLSIKIFAFFNLFSNFGHFSVIEWKSTKSCFPLWKNYQI